MLDPPEYSSAMAVKIDSVPSVTMNGGRLTRVTSKPLSSPAPTARATPMRIARNPGTPFSAARVAMTIIARMATAPTDRSMPAVRMTSVCPIARHAMTATCWSSSDWALGEM